MKILVTGNCGFIGQNFIRMYRDEHELIGIDKMSYASDADAAKLCTTYVEDISSPDFLERFKLIDEKHGQFDAIVNFAAESHVDNSIASPKPFMYSNFIGTYNMLEAARQYGVKRFLQIGTDEVYGDLNETDPPFSNLHEMKPSSPYSASKASSDLIALSYCRTYDMDIVVTRSCNNYGPHQHTEKLIPVIITKAKEDKKIPIYGTGMNIREWIHVRDNCSGVMAVLESGETGGIYNIGSGIELTNIDIAKCILSLMNKPDTLMEMVKDRKGHDFRYALEFSKIIELGWKPEINLEDGLRETIKFYNRS